eukprot:TRINITY_DN2052_c0_g1_i1.p1 TRINITY_DN2052_c0_g1~~TRINITY_DN2052_c0_g1_i1.p1  ORF type:complete len:308 (-),score=100.15 TRINITY_DN2052_c0_g1_i1:1763-2557(-)
MAAFVAAAGGGRLGARRAPVGAVVSTRPAGVAGAASRRLPVAMVAETAAVAEGNSSAPEVKLTSSGEDGDASKSVVQSMEDVEAIISMAAELQLGDVRLSHEGITLEVTFPGGAGFDADGNLQVPPAPVMAAAPAAMAAAPAPALMEAAPADEVEEDDGEVDEAPLPSWETSSDDGASDGGGVVESDFTVSSNRVGFFYSGAKNKPPLVNVGDHVGFNQPVCIIEQLSAQYVYKSEVSGTVVAVCLEDGDPVEYGQKLMAIRPD